MLRFKYFLEEIDMTYDEISKILIGLGYEIKPVTRARMAIITDKRQAALNKVLEIFKGARLSRDRSSLSISSLGVIYIGNVQVIVKPKSRNVLKAEQEATESLISIVREAVEQEGKPIDIMIGSYRIKSVVTAGSNQIKGDPKADIALIDSLNKEVGFISHKKEGGAKAFQQYSGISKNAGITIYADSLVKTYVKDLREIVLTKFGTNSTKRGFAVYRKIPNNAAGKNLVSRSVYGPEWNTGRFNRNSVHCIGQGTPILSRNSDGSYKLSFSETIHTADDVNWAFKGDYQAIFVSTFRSDRSTMHEGGIVVNYTRSGIYPLDYLKGRKATEI